MNATKLFFAAVKASDSAAALRAIDAGADVNAVADRGESAVVEVHAALLRAPHRARADWWQLMAATVKAGARLNETEEHLIAPLDFPALIWNPDLQAVIAQLERLADYSGRDYQSPGTAYFVKCRQILPHDWSATRRIHEEQERTADYRKAVSQLADSTRRLGGTLVTGPEPAKPGGCSALLHCLHLLPTTDKYTVVALFGFADWSEGESPASTIPKLKELDSQWPFHVRGVGQKQLEIEFLQEVANGEALIHELKGLFSLDYWHTPEDICNAARWLTGRRSLSIRLGVG